MKLKKIKKSVTRYLALSVVGVLVINTSFGQLPTAQQIAKQMKVGWNMGNTLEAIGGETAWGGVKTTQALIDSVKKDGFNTIRLPVAWFTHSDTITSVIDEAWMARVKEVVDYCINDDIYVIINMHWDSGWLEKRVNSANESIVNNRLYEYWTQIADNFKEYDEHLLFAGANEPNVEDAAGMEVLMSFHQTFIDAVRASGGNNSTRTLIIQGPSTDIDKTNKLMNSLPVDEIENRLMVEVHYYTPYQFCLMSEDATWGKMAYYWGKDFHSTTDVSRNATWGEEAELDRLFGLMKTKFVDKGIPVIVGEFGAYKRKLSAPSDQELHNKSVEYFNKCVVKSALSKGMIPYYWDTNNGLFNRSKGTVLDTGLLNGLMQGAEEAHYLGTHFPKIQQTLDLYPNPFTSSLNLKVENPDKVVSIKIFDGIGNSVEAVKNSEIRSSNTLGSSLKPGQYFVQVCGENWMKSFKRLKVIN
jgi:aryl-phospho-beta-D-glucosidase BglC (GH1 family)